MTVHYLQKSNTQTYHSGNPSQQSYVPSVSSQALAFMHHNENVADYQRLQTMNLQSVAEMKLTGGHYW